MPTSKTSKNDIINEVKSKTKSNFRARIDNNQKLIKNVANFGLSKGQIAVRMGEGEYTGFSVKALEDIKPLITDIRIIRALKFLNSDDIQSVINILHLRDEVVKYGTNIIYTLLCTWFEKNEIIPPNEYLLKVVKVDDSALTKYITNVRSNPLMGKVEIVDIGQSKKGHSVVPQDWMGRIYSDGYQLHSSMDYLDWRKNKPPTSYCCIYSMMVKESFKWKQNIPSNEKYINNFNALFAVNITLDKSKIVFFRDKKEYQNWLLTLSSDVNILPCQTKTMERYIIVCHLNKITNSSNKYIKTDNVGFLVSQLQKCIRRGRQCSKLLSDTVINLGQSRPYNLPEQQYIKVSANRQLCWRLFITIVEDVEPYLPHPNNLYYSMEDILSLALLAQNDPDLQFNDKIINKLLYTSLLIQCNDHDILWNWKKSSEKFNPKFGNSKTDYFKVALMSMPMMKNDSKLLAKTINNLTTYKLNILNTVTIKELLENHDQNSYDLCKYASNDMHCNPNITIYLQSAIPFIPCDIKKHSTYSLSSFIWENSSKINVRYPTSIILSPTNKLILDSLHNVQRNCSYQLPNIQFQTEKLVENESPYCELSNYEKRLGFVLVFGRRIRISGDNSIGKSKLKSVDVMVVGDKDEPFKIKWNDKYLEKPESDVYVNRFIQYINENEIIIQLPPPPEFCDWIDDKNNKLSQGKLKVTQNRSGKYRFYFNNIELPLFDSNRILKKYKLSQEKNLPINVFDIVRQTLYYPIYTSYNCWQLNSILSELHHLRIKSNDVLPYKWKFLCDKIPTGVLHCLLSKLYNNFKSEVQIGPVDRHGKKLHDSVNYLYEGVLLRLFNLLSFIYPLVIQPISTLKFKLNKNRPEYINLIEIINSLIINSSNSMIKEDFNIPQIKTKLWNNQLKTSEKIFNDMTIYDKKGFGDASSVGSGKTLTSLSVMVKILEYHSKKYNKECGVGFLVLLPTLKLFDTWRNEIKKHTVGFHIVEQSSDGKLNGTIKLNTIMITTLGRIRDHPLYRYWNLVIIDECLSVQNKDALQTEEAWKQVMCSKYGVLMMSATFFRSRFDKLFYMLKMLRSGIPESREYLDTILCESIVCNLVKTDREWKVSTNRFPLSNELRDEYDKILYSSQSAEQIYIQLTKLLFDKFNYLNCFYNVIKKVEKRDGKALIYTRSKHEADILSVKMKTVSRYPDKSGKHTVLSYNEGTYGLNDLIVYDTIITRPPESDKLPQMKGRLDRPGNKNNLLHLEYLLAQDTIDEASLIRIELCNSFYKDHIMPLADFYKLAIKQSYSIDMCVKKCQKELDDFIGEERKLNEKMALILKY